MTVLIKLATAVICFQHHCYPILYGNTTPLGEYQMSLMPTDKRGYGGDVIKFLQVDNQVYAIHRTWLLNAKQHRPTRLQSTNLHDRIITNGCINIDPKVYARLKNCCAQDIVVIKN